MKPHFINTCSLFFECPLGSHDLEGKHKTRFCNQCGKDVIWCDNKTDYNPLKMTLFQ